MKKIISILMAAFSGVIGIFSNIQIANADDLDTSDIYKVDTDKGPEDKKDDKTYWIFYASKYYKHSDKTQIHVGDIYHCYLHYFVEEHFHYYYYYSYY